MGEGMRRIFRLMRDADLVAPELQSEAGRFCMILHHKSVFSDSDQRWLDEFRPFKLTREEMLIAMLGKEGNLLSPQQIYARLSLVDWDVYRSIIEQIQAKGVLYNTMAQRVKVKQARGKNVSQRAIPRLAVRQPAELEQALLGLQEVLRQLGPKEVINSLYVNEILGKLPRKNPYHTNALELTKTLRLLGLMDDSRLPTGITIGVWGHSTVPRNAAGSLAKQRAGGHAPGPESPEAARARAAAPVRGKARVPPIRKEKPCEIFVGNLDRETSPQELESLFSPYGQVISVRLPPDYVTGRSRGFAFIRMRDRWAAAKAIEKLSGQLLRGRPLRVSW